MKWKKKTFPIRNKGEAEPLTIVHDAAMANPEFGEGRLIPLLILDISERPDISDLISLHQSTPSGDVTVTWGRRSRSKRNVALLLQFERPIEATVCIEFRVDKYGSVIDLMLGSNALYIQGGKSGDRLSSTLDESRLLVEIPDTGFDKEWSDLWLSELIKKFKQSGLSRKAAKTMALQYMDSMREAKRINTSPA